MRSPQYDGGIYSDCYDRSVLNSGILGTDLWEVSLTLIELAVSLVTAAISKVADFMQ